MNRGLMVYAGKMARMMNQPRLKFVSADNIDTVTYIDLANVCRLDFEPGKETGQVVLTVYSNTINPSTILLSSDCAELVMDEYEADSLDDKSVRIAQQTPQ